MNIDPTASNGALAAAVNSRINADARIIRAKAAMWRLAGLGVLSALVGAGVGVAFYGYSYIHDATNTAERMADVISKALEKATVTGEVKLARDQSVKLDPQAEVALKDGSELGVSGSVALKDGGMVRIDPSSKVGVTGTVGVSGDVPRPTEGQLRGGGSAPQPANVVRNYTIFTHVPFGSGSVVTGWTFGSSEQTVPTQQYCYYGTPVEDAVQVRVDLAYDGVAIATKRPNGLDVDAAMAQCSWYDGSRTRHAAVDLPQTPARIRPPGEVDGLCQNASPATGHDRCGEVLGPNGARPSAKKGKVY